MYLRRRGLSAPVLIVLGLFIGLLIAALVASPRIIEISPPPDASQVPALAAIRIGFSHPMNKDSVISRLAIDPPMEGHLEWQSDTLIFHPEALWPPETKVTVRLAAGARSERYLPLLHRREWSFSIGVPRIVYLWPSEGPADLYLQSPGSEVRERLTKTRFGIQQYSLSLDGTRIAYAAEREDGGTDLRWLDMITGVDHLLQSCSHGSRCDAPAISPQGEVLAYEHSEFQLGMAGQPVSGPSQVWAVPLEGDAQAIPVGPHDHISTTPRWLPNGRLAYYDNAFRALVVVDPSSGPEPPALNLVPSELGYLSTWSPDGRYLILPEFIFLAENDGAPEKTAGRPAQDSRADFYSHLKRVDLATGSSVDLSGEEAGLVEDASPAYSPDGTWVAFTRKFLDNAHWTLGHQLWLMKSDGSEAHQLTFDPEFNFSALAWSPDSSDLAYMRFNQADMAQPPEIWWTNIADGNPQRLVLGGYIPKWIP